MTCRVFVLWSLDWYLSNAMTFNFLIEKQLIVYLKYMAAQGLNCTFTNRKVQSFSKVLGQMPQIHILFPNANPPAPYSMLDHI